MSDEPFYVRQTAGIETHADRTAWVQEAIGAATIEAGCRIWWRATVHPDHNDMVLFEAWRDRPADEGEQRWALKAKE